MKLYTKQGDGGRSSTMTRMNIPKSSPIFELLGTLDELNAALGTAKRKTPPALGELAEQLQNDLIAVCGELAGGNKFVTRDQVTRLEGAIDQLMATVPEFHGFVLPGGSEGGAALDVARTVARRAERCAVAVSQTGGIPRELLMWLNRLSDLLYALARLCDQTTGNGSVPASIPASIPAGVTAPVKTAAVAAISPSAVHADAAASAAPAMTAAPRMALTQEDGFCDMANALCREVRQEARRQGIRVVAAVCDAGGNPVATQRDDEAYIASVDIAVNKAYTSVALKMPTEEVGRLAQPGAPLYGIQHTNEGRIVIFGGGMPLLRGGVIVGGLGVSGGSAEQDTALVHYGVEVFQKGESSG